MENAISASRTERVVSSSVPSNVIERDEPSKARKEKCPETQVFPKISEVNAANVRDALVAINTPLPEMNLVAPILRQSSKSRARSMPPQFPPQELTVPASHRVFSQKIDTRHDFKHVKNALSSPSVLRKLAPGGQQAPLIMPPKFPPEELRMIYTTPNQPSKSKGRASSAPPESSQADKPNARTRALKNRHCNQGRSGADAFQTCLQGLCERLRAQGKAPSYMLLKKYVVEKWGPQMFDSRRDEVISVLFTVNSTLSPQNQQTNRATVKKQKSFRVNIVKVISRVLSHSHAHRKRTIIAPSQYAMYACQGEDTPPRAKLDPRQQSIFDLIESERTYRDDLAVLVKQCMRPLQQQQQQHLRLAEQEKLKRGTYPKKRPSKRGLIFGFFKKSKNAQSQKAKTLQPRKNLPANAEQKPVLSQSQVCTIFRNLDSLYELSKNLHGDLAKQGVHGGVGQVMLRYSAFFKMYVAYFMGAEQGMQLVHDLTSKNQRFKVCIALSIKMFTHLRVHY